MADEYNHSSNQNNAGMKTEEAAAPPAIETSDRGLLDFAKKKKEGHDQEAIAAAAKFDEKLKVSELEEKKLEADKCKKKEEEEEREKKKQGGILEKLHRSSSSSSSSSDKEEGDDEEKKKRRKEKKEKKSLKEKIKEKLPGGNYEKEVKKEEEKKKHEVEVHTAVPVEKIHVEEVKYSEPSYHHADADHEKKGFVDKIKEKLPGHAQKKPDDHDRHGDKTPAADTTVSPPPPPAGECEAEQGGEEKEKKGFLEKIKEKIPVFHPKNTEEEKEKERAST